MLHNCYPQSSIFYLLLCLYIQSRFFLNPIFLSKIACSVIFNHTVICFLHFSYQQKQTPNKIYVWNDMFCSSWHNYSHFCTVLIMAHISWRATHECQVCHIYRRVIMPLVCQAFQCVRWTNKVRVHIAIIILMCSYTYYTQLASKVPSIIFLFWVQLYLIKF